MPLLCGFSSITEINYERGTIDHCISEVNYTETGWMERKQKEDTVLFGFAAERSNFACIDKTGDVLEARRPYGEQLIEFLEDAEEGLEILPHLWPLLESDKQNHQK